MKPQAKAEKNNRLTSQAISLGKQRAENFFLSSFTIALSLFLMMFLAACAGNSSSTGTIPLDTKELTSEAPIQKPAPIEKARVALLLPLSAKGKTASIAAQLKQAAELAVFDADNPNFQLTVYDTKGSPEGAKEAAQKSLIEGNELILGPLFATSVSAVSPIARQANVPVVSFSTNETVAGNGTYLLSFLAGRDVDQIVSYAASQGKKQFAALIPNNQYGAAAEKFFRASVARHGGQIIALEKFDRDPNAMLPPTKKVAEAITARGAQALFIPGGKESLPSLSALLPYNKIDTKNIKLIGTGRWDYPTIGSEKPLLGGWFPAPDPSGWRQFSQHYVQSYGEVPNRIASLSFDAVSLAVSLANNPKGARYVPEQLTRASGFSGVDGLFRLTPNGLSERGLAIIEVQQYGNKVIQKAPTSFGIGNF